MNIKEIYSTLPIFDDLPIGAYLYFVSPYHGGTLSKVMYQKIAEDKVWSEEKGISPPFINRRKMKVLEVKEI